MLPRGESGAPNPTGSRLPFCRKKQRRLNDDDDPTRDGDWWGYIALDPVHEFRLGNGAPAYAWTYIEDEASGRRRFMAVLGVGPIDGPSAAVRAAIASGQQG